MIYEIKKKNDQVLRKECEPIKEFDFELQKTIDDMFATMRKRKGIGLAAPQIGLSKKIFVIEFEGDKEDGIPAIPQTVLCNPEITFYSKEQVSMVEGCLSFPGIEVVVKRPKEITIKGQDRYGNYIEIKADGLLARVLQHEFDHLNSTLLIDKMQKSKIIFIGTGTLGLDALTLLNKDPQYEILSVITSAEEKIVSRKQKTQNPIFDLAESLNLPIIRTENIKDEKIIAKVKSLKPDLGVMADFGQIIPKALLDLPKYGILNIHPSLLPKYRGPAPVQSTILFGEKFAGVSIMLTESKMDAGPVIFQGKVELSGKETSTILKNYLAEYGAKLLMNAIPYYITGDLKPRIQNEAEATFSQIIKKEDAFVDQNTSELEVERKIRAFNEWPKVYTIVDKKRVILLESHFEENGDFLLDLVKPEGKKAMTYIEYLRGYRKEIKFKKV